MRPQLSALAASLILLACNDPGPQPLTVRVVELPSPAGSWSGEPFLAAAGDAVYMSWIDSVGPGRHALRMAALRSDVWEEPVTVAESGRFFVNWADFPSISAHPDGTLWAHWLERGEAGGYDYGVRVTRSRDGGRSWTEPWTPHDDVSPTEHGFVSAIPLGSAMGFVWLDGRKYAVGPDGSEPSREMTVRFRTATGAGDAGPETLLDPRACDCCQTDAAVTSEGPIVAYRDRSPDEVRDIYVTRMVGEEWTDGAPVHADGWKIGGCPVNGPAIAARGEQVAIAWFTAAADTPRVRVAFSSDAGATFAAPLQVDGGNPLGRVDLLLTEAGAAWVVWLERTGGEGAEIRLREVRSDGSMSEASALTTSSSARASGFPRVAAAPGGGAVFAWTDLAGELPRVRVARLEIER